MVLRGAALQCQPLPKQLELLHMQLESLFQWEYSRLRILCFPDSKIQGVDLECPLVLSARDPRQGHSPQLQCKACFCHLVLNGLDQGLKHELFLVSFVQIIFIPQGPIQNHSSSGSLDREGLQSDCNLGYASSKNAQHLLRLLLPFC